MTVTIPPGVPSDGMVKIAAVPAIADLEAPSIATDLGATGAKDDISCWLTSAFAPSGDPATVTDRRMCSKQVFEDFGVITFTIDNLVYVYDTQDAEGLSNELYAMLPTGWTGYLVVGWGKDTEEAWVAGDVVDIYPVKMGPRVKQAQEENAKLKVAQKPFVTGKLIEDVALAA